MDIFETIVAKAAGISAGGPLAGVLSGRSDVLELGNVDRGFSPTVSYVVNEYRV